MDQTHGCKSVKRRIDPTIERDVGRTLICRRRSSVSFDKGSDGSPLTTAERRIVMSAINILRDEISDDAVDQYIGGKVLMAAHARNVHQGSKAVGDGFHERAGIFVRDYPRHRPCSGRMFRGERRSTVLKKRPGAVALKRTLAAQGIFESIHYHQAVQRCFTCKESGLAPVIVVLGMTQKPHSSRPANKCRDPRI